MAHTVSTFLMFTGAAEEAMSFYASLFPDAEIGSVEKHGPGEPGAEGTIKRADMTINGHHLMFFDSPPMHDFTFTPSISLFIDCENEEELERLYSALLEGGQGLMPMDNYGFSSKFGWVNDRFGVSWQVNLK